MSTVLQGDKNRGVSVHLDAIWGSVMKPERDHEGKAEQKRLFCSTPTHLSVGDIPGKKHQLHSVHRAVHCQRFALFQDRLWRVDVGVKCLWDWDGKRECGGEEEEVVVWFIKTVCRKVFSSPNQSPN